MVAEIGVLCTGRDDELVEGDGPAVGDNLLAADIDAGNLRQHHRRVGLLSQDVPDRRRDVGG